MSLPDTVGALASPLALEIELPLSRSAADGAQAGGHGGGSRARLRFVEGFLRGGSPAMKSLFAEMARLAATRIPILLTGETGTGKELLAQTLHRSSPRASRPFLAMNCAAIPPDLLEPEMFGIEKGVATGVEGRPGKFAQAHGGTLFLDEIGEMPAGLQAKLLRALQAEEVQPVGGRPRPIDVRVISATNADVQARIESRRFRPDLYYRLAGAVFRVPPLRERPEDIPSLIEGLLRRYAAEAGKRRLGLTLKALEALTSYPWPGNVRELQNELRRLAHLSVEGAVIDADDLSLATSALEAKSPLAGVPAPRESLELAPRVAELERVLIEEALRRTRGNRSQAAQLLGIARNTLADKLGRLGIEVP